MMARTIKRDILHSLKGIFPTIYFPQYCTANGKNQMRNIFRAKRKTLIKFR